MKFTLSWLKEHLDTDASLETILKALNDIGLEVEGVENPAEKLSGFKVAKVLTAAPHPQADKLQVLTVDQGDGNPLQVVCGAPNARAGLVGVFGVEGAAVKHPKYQGSMHWLDEFIQTVVLRMMRSRTQGGVYVSNDKGRTVVMNGLKREIGSLLAPSAAPAKVPQKPFSPAPTKSIIP